jgi:enamine deaminase RidA (YjgF/YER057c/UK114 family)
MKRRQTLSGEGIPAHAQPFPTAVKIDRMVFSSAIAGRDPETGKLPEGLEEQIRNVFAHVASVMRVAGGTTADIAKVTVYLNDRDNRAKVNPHWIAMFPDEDDRPVRHTVAAPLPEGTHIQIEFIAVLGEG